MIGRLPYYHFPLLEENPRGWNSDWNTAVFILPFTRSWNASSSVRIGRLPYLYFLLLIIPVCVILTDWKTAVFILPSTQTDHERMPIGIGILPCLYFLLLLVSKGNVPDDWKTAVFILLLLQIVAYTLEIGLEDCRITTSFYYCLGWLRATWIGILPYLYFLLLCFRRNVARIDWNTAVLLLPFTAWLGLLIFFRLEYCRIITSFY